MGDTKGYSLKEKAKRKENKLRDFFCQRRKKINNENRKDIQNDEYQAPKKKNILWLGKIFKNKGTQEKLIYTAPVCRPYYSYYI